MTVGLSVILEAKRRGSSASLYWIFRHVVPQNDVVAKMSSLFFITEPRSRGFAPSSEVLRYRHPDAEGGRIQ